jgi:DNA-binding MarR family transcriptional regulator
MSGLVDRMEQRGFVRRAPGRDRRSHLLQITPKGSALVEKAWPRHADAISRLSHEIDPRDADVLLRVLEQLRAGGAP